MLDLHLPIGRWLRIDVWRQGNLDRESRTSDLRLLMSAMQVREDDGGFGPDVLNLPDRVVGLRAHGLIIYGGEGDIT